MTALPRPARAGAFTAVLALTASTLLVLGAPPAEAGRSEPSVRWTKSFVVLGGKAKAVVRPSSRPQGSTLVLQRRDLDRWRTVDDEAERTDRGLVLRVPTEQLGRFRFRVAAKDHGDVRSASDTWRVRVHPAYDPAGNASDHTFLGNRRFRWDSCRPVTWAFNREHAPEHALGQIRKTIAKARRATGLRFEYAGRTRERPGLQPHEGKYQIIIGWRRPRSFAYFGNHPGRVGVGGASWHSGYQEADGTRVNRAWSGRLILNARYDDDLRQGYGRGYTWGDVILHEFGHVLGLGHVEERSQVMYPQMTKRKARWGAGDLAGLQKLGSKRGCLERVSGRVHGNEVSAISR